MRGGELSRAGGTVPGSAPVEGPELDAGDGARDALIAVSAGG